MNRRNQILIGIAAAAALSLAFLAGLARGQSAAGAKGEAIKVMEPHDPPFESQVKTLLEGASADMLRGGRLFVLTNARLSTFSTNGTLEMRAETPSCIYDSALKTVSSEQRLQVWTADGMFTEGYGFLFQFTNSNIIISNRVRTVVRGSWTNSFIR